MLRRMFPIVYATDVETTTAFYERFGFARHFQLPPDGPAGYVGLRCGDTQLAVVDRTWPAEQYGVEPGDAPKFELFVYVDDADAVIESLRDAGTTVLRPAADMPWGERVGFVLDPDGNPVAVATDPGDGG